jgi:hypothetical protein
MSKSAAGTEWPPTKAFFVQSHNILSCVRAKMGNFSE